MRGRRWSALVCAAAALAGCGGGDHAAAVAQPAKPLAEAALLHDLPGGNFVIAGGSYDAMPHLMQSAVGKWFVTVMGKLGMQSQDTWMSCFARFRGARFVGGLALDGFSFRLRALTAGLGMRDVVGCAREAGIPFTVDPDGKFATVTFTAKGRTMISPYLELPDGVVYSATRFAIGPLPDQPTRKDMEADIAQARKHSAADDAAMIAIASHADHSRMVWFAGTGAGTPLAGKVGEAYGTIDLAGGLRVDLSTQLLDPVLADQVMKAYSATLEHPGSMSPEMRTVFDHLDLRRTGDRLHLLLQVSDQDLASFLATLVPGHDDVRMQEAIDHMQQFETEMCACKDVACAQQVSKEMTRWSQDMQRDHHEVVRPSEAQTRQMAQITRDMVDCMTKAMSMGATSTGSGSGSATP